MLFSGLLLAGVAALAASLVPFSVLLARVRSMSDSGQGTFFTHEFYRAIQMRLRLIGVANLVPGWPYFGSVDKCITGRDKSPGTP